jgi:hypothetical protein
MGGRWTPLATWRGYGQLRTKSGGGYPLYVSFFPGSHFSPLHLDGLRPTGGLKGSGWICTSPGAIQHLDLTGTIYGAWRSTDGGLLTLRLLEPKIIDVGQGQGFFDLTGRWQGGELVMDDRGGVPEAFRSGLRIERASVTLSWGTYSEFKELCAKATNHSADR